MARKPDPRKPLKARPNPLDAARITYIDYKDTDLLRKFRPRQDPQPQGEPGERPAAAAARRRHQERPGDGAAAVLRFR
nr:30S ribosomal protein S18 [Streptomyces luridiscabiei]